MKSKITLPQKLEFEKGARENETRAIISPCFPGYGTTLGNALRRVLLSSLPGAAVVRVKIKNAKHEFMGLPHVKEDVLEMILNLKKLRVKMFTEEEVKLTLEVRGKKEVKASDIKSDPSVEIVNSDLVLAHITDAAGSLEMEITVAPGMGYESTEAREGKNLEVDAIEIDSIFSPVLNVSIDVENVRVGKMTNWDKLILTILTDGTIDPEEALNRSIEILLGQFNALAIGGAANEKDSEEAVAEVEEVKEVEEKAEENSESEEEEKSSKAKAKKKKK